MDLPTSAEYRAPVKNTQMPLTGVTVTNEDCNKLARLRVTGSAGSSPTENQIV